jgi:uncharacterized protein
MTDKRVAVITGASSGIGTETALAFARKGYSLALGARRVDRLEQVAAQCAALGVKAIWRSTDVRVAAQVRALVQAAKDELGRLDVLVNNAGSGLFAKVQDLSEADVRGLFDVNFYGVLYGCQAAVPIMMDQGGGHIFNVSSVIGKRGTPFHGAYCATKFAVCGLSESMRVELRPQNIFVTTVCPALTETEFFSHSPSGQKAKSSFVKIKRMMPADVVGRKIAATAGRPKPELVFSAGGKFLVLVSALFPSLADKMMSAYYADLDKKMP